MSLKLEQIEHLEHGAHEWKKYSHSRKWRKQARNRKIRRVPQDEIPHIKYKGYEY